LIPGLGSLLNFKVIENAPGRSGLRDFDTVLYFLCDDLSCGWIYRAALEHPGVLVLNDARPDFRSIVRSVATDHSDVVLVEAYYELFGEDWRWRSGKTLEAIALPGQPFSMTRRILDRSRACIVHNTLAEEQVRGKGFRRPLARIPWGTRLSALDGAATREQFGFHQSNAVIGIFGFTADEIEVCGILEVFSRLCEVAQHVRLLIVCRPSDQSRLAERITYGHLTSRVRVVPQTGAFDALIATCDVVWNIRSDPSDESVQLAVQAMGQGKVVLLSDSAQNRDFPSDGCVRIPADSSRRRVTLKVLHWLTSNLEAIAEIGQTGATWASQDQKWDDVARKFADFINNCETGETLKRNTLRDDETCDYLLRWVQPDDSAAYFKLHASRLIRTLALTPWAQSGDRVLEMGCYLQMTAGLQHLLGYEVRGCYLGSRGRDRKIIRSSEGEIFECLIDLFNCEKDHFPYPDQHFATVLCCELIEHLKEDPMHMMREINRILKPGGSLVLTTPNATSLRAVNAILSGDHPAYYNSYPDPARRRFEAPRHEREYTPKELVRLFAHSGFSVETVVTGPYDETSGDRFPAVSRILNALGEASSLRDECVFIVGRKSGSPAPHLPEWLYDAL
jgi:SAM-dependent methyltransferase